LARWQKQPELAHLTLAVNVSARQFQQADFVEQLFMILEEYSVDATKLKLELTESLFVIGVDQVMSKMEQLKARGVRFSLDDFGTGYSSLSYLKRLPLDQLKIDQGFVRDIMDDPNDKAIAQMVIALAKTLELDVIAEGVETAEQQAVLAEMGCEHYQGYLFGRPQSIELFESLFTLPEGKAN
jgi:EAL domain-containing protein (putative c-di-GMP-specific phosphodiesterase class I)